MIAPTLQTRKQRERTTCCRSWIASSRARIWTHSPGSGCPPPSHSVSQTCPVAQAIEVFLQDMRPKRVLAHLSPAPYHSGASPSFPRVSPLAEILTQPNVQSFIPRSLMLLIYLNVPGDSPLRKAHGGTKGIVSPLLWWPLTLVHCRVWTAPGWKISRDPDSAPPKVGERQVEKWINGMKYPNYPISCKAF